MAGSSLSIIWNGSMGPIIHDENDEHAIEMIIGMIMGTGMVLVMNNRYYGW